jgi:hypothetical protein
MSDTLSFTEIDAQHVELLPARTVLSMMISTGWKPPHDNGNNSGNGGVALNVANLNNVGNVNVGGHQHITGIQTNIAQANGHSGFTSYGYNNGNYSGNGGLAVNAGNLNNVGNVNVFGNQPITGVQTNIAQANGRG